MANLNNARFIIGSQVLAILGVVASACGGQSSNFSQTNDGGGHSIGVSGASGASSGSSGSANNGGHSSGGSPGTAGASSGGASNVAGSGAGGSSSVAGSGAGGGAGQSSIVPIDHRMSDAMCSEARPSNACPPAFQEGSSCKTDSDCTAGTNGRCTGVGITPACACSYDHCAKDADCSPGSICLCDRDNGNTCVQSECRIDSDCGLRGYCSSNRTDCGEFEGYHCHTPKDTCVNDADCRQDILERCAYAADKGQWVCRGYGTECPTT